MSLEPRQLQIPPPKAWQAFEDLTQALFAAIWNDPNTQKNGRQGQPQHGVDVFGSPSRDHRHIEGVQCKGRDQSYNGFASAIEIDEELVKADSFEPGLAHWTLVTTAPSDGRLQTHARKISAERAIQGLFPITVLGWEEIQQRLCEYPEVLKRFYPGHAFDISGLLTRLESILQGSIQESTAQNPCWRPVAFKGERDFGPALLGRPLGPSDAEACPRLNEADIIVADLLHGYSARLVGDPGGGKSVCAYQAAATLSARGWKIFQLNDPTTLNDLPSCDDQALFIVDDAHLSPSGRLSAAEAAAGPRRLLLSVHNGVGRDVSTRGAVVIERRKAVRTIAAGFRKDPRTLAVVKGLDNEIGTRAWDADLQQRIDHAEEKAHYPWQFCFILGGGWQRAERAADTARAAGADLILAAIAVRQLGSRDARPTHQEILSLIGQAEISEADVREALIWLARERLIISFEDLRCPHQRFSSVVLKKILAGQDHAGRAVVSKILQAVVADPKLPLAGLYVLLFELQFGDRLHTWTHLIPPAALRPAVKRAWQAPADVRGYASLLLMQTESFVVEWPRDILNGREDTLVAWLNSVDGRSAHGLARLVNNLCNKDAETARRLLNRCDPQKIANTISCATPADAYELGGFAGRLWFLRDTDWARNFKAGLRRDALINLANSWPTDSDLYGLAKLCEGLALVDEALTLDMVQTALPQIQQRVAKDPVGTFREIDDIISRVLRVLDVLNVFKGNLAPSKRQWALARAIVSDVHPKILGDQLSNTRLLYFQSMSFLLIFLRRANPSKFKATVTAIDWNQISENIGEHWDDLPHDAAVLLSVAFAAPKVRVVIRQIIIINLYRIDKLSARLACIAPEAAERFLDQGKFIATGFGSHVEWGYTRALVCLFSENRPDLVNALLAPAESAAAKAFSHTHESWYREATLTLIVLRERVPQALSRILNAIEPVPAEIGWTAALRKGGEPRRTAALLIDAALKRKDPVGEVARRLRASFPKISQPRQADLTPSMP